MELGGYDHRILTWLAQWEPETAAVICGWLTRATGPGKPGAVTLTAGQASVAADALAEAASARRDHAGAYCHDCAEHPAELCPGHEADLIKADDYDRFGALLATPTGHGGHARPASAASGTGQPPAADRPGGLAGRGGECAVSQEAAEAGPGL